MPNAGTVGMSNVSTNRCATVPNSSRRAFLWAEVPPGNTAVEERRTGKYHGQAVPQVTSRLFLKRSDRPDAHWCLVLVRDAAGQDSCMLDELAGQAALKPSCPSNNGGW